MLENLTKSPSWACCVSHGHIDRWFQRTYGQLILLYYPVIEIALFPRAISLVRCDVRHDPFSPILGFLVGFPSPFALGLAPFWDCIVMTF